MTGDKIFNQSEFDLFDFRFYKADTNIPVTCNVRSIEQNQEIEYYCANQKPAGQSTHNDLIYAFFTARDQTRNNPRLGFQFFPGTDNITITKDSIIYKNVKGNTGKASLEKTLIDENLVPDDSTFGHNKMLGERCIVTSECADLYVCRNGICSSN